MAKKAKVLITVMTYPHPSEGYLEVVCTAGITEAGEWIRLYPIDYRYQPKHSQFRKYQWIEVELEKSPAKKDKRPESFRPKLDTIQIIGERLSTKNGWRERRDYIDSMPHKTIKEWMALHEKNKTSLGIVRPKRILDLEISPVEDEEWKPKWKALYSQPRLFGPQPKPLSKLPFTFHYIFKCEDDDKPHTAMCEDWELGVLFLKELRSLAQTPLPRVFAKNISTSFAAKTRIQGSSWGLSFPTIPGLYLECFGLQRTNSSNSSAKLVCRPDSSNYYQFTVESI